MKYFSGKYFIPWKQVDLWHFCLAWWGIQDSFFLVKRIFLFLQQRWKIGYNLFCKKMEEQLGFTFKSNPIFDKETIDFEAM